MQMFKRVFAATILTLGATAAHAQAAPATTLPNFGGTWEMNATKSNFGQFPLPAKYTMTVEQTATMIKAVQVMSSPNGDFNTKADFSLEGKPTTGEGFGGSTTTTTAKLEAAGLTANTKVSMQQGEMTQVTKWLLSADGKQLTIEQAMSSQMGEMSFHIVLDKKP